MLPFARIVSVALAQGAPPSAVPDSVTKAALTQLADIVTPPPPDWWPHTWGWVALAVLVGLTLAGFVVQALRRRRANGYRREALAELGRLEARCDDAGQRAEALAELAALFKRTALAAWPRARVASLSGRRWTRFLAANGTAKFDPAAERLLDDLEYRGEDALRSVPASDARAALRAARVWIVGHRVRPEQPHVSA